MYQILKVVVEIVILDNLSNICIVTKEMLGNIKTH